MLSGRYRKYFLYEWSATYTLVDAHSGGVSMISYWAPNSADKPVGISLELSTSDATMSDDTELTVTIPVLAYSGTFNTGGFLASCTARIEIDNLTVYMHPVAPNPYGGWSLRFDELRIYLNGVLVHTIGAQTILSAYFTPAGIPLLGVPPRVTGNGGIGTVPVAGSALSCATEYETTEDGACQFSGGWRLKVNAGDAWQSAPVSLNLPSVSMPEGCDCSIALPEWPSLTVTDTWSGSGTAGSVLVSRCEKTATGEQCTPCGDLHVVIPTIRDVYKGTLTYKTYSSSFMLLPNCPKSVRRWKPANYRQMVLRGGFPQSFSQGIATCGPWDVDPDLQLSNSTTPEVYPALTAYLANVGDAVHTIEDPFGYDSYAPASTGRTIGQSISYSQVTTQNGLCGLFVDPSGLPSCTLPADSTCYASEIKAAYVSVQTSLDNPYIAPNYDHDDDECRLINTWFSPHISYFVWFPPNTIDTDMNGIPEDQNIWPVRTTPYPVEYWLDVRSQYGYQSALPVGEQTRTRNQLPMDGLSYHDLGVWIMVVTGGLLGTQGIHSGFWGSQNFIVDDFAPPASLAFDSTSEDLFTATNCTLSFGGGGITVTPDPGETELTIECDLGSFSTYPYMYPHLAAMFALDWTVSGATVAVYFVSREGTTRLITDTPGTFARPLGLDGKYAYSYAQDYGTGRLYDTGEDNPLLVSGISADVMGDPESAHFFQMLAGRGASKLRWVITIT